MTEVERTKKQSQRRACAGFDEQVMRHETVNCQQTPMMPAGKNEKKNCGKAAFLVYDGCLEQNMPKWQMLYTRYKG